MCTTAPLKSPCAQPDRKPASPETRYAQFADTLTDWSRDARTSYRSCTVLLEYNTSNENIGIQHHHLTIKQKASLTK